MIRTILGWLVAARRSLKWQEIQMAYCIDPDANYIPFEEERLQVHIREDCGSVSLESFFVTIRVH
jgi:hypothetical protein